MNWNSFSPGSGVLTVSTWPNAAANADRKRITMEIFCFIEVPHNDGREGDEATAGTNRVRPGCSLNLLLDIGLDICDAESDAIVLRAAKAAGHRCGSYACQLGSCLHNFELQC